MVSGSAPETLERKVYFYRADIGTDEGGQRFSFDPSPALDAIDSLPFTNDAHGRYEFDADGNALSIRRHNTVPNVTLQFGRVRRNGLPMLEQAGNISDLVLDADAGLLEAIHIVFFPNNIVGAEYNHFGPRVSSTQSTWFWDETFPAEEARRIARRLEFHYTPKHGSWLNMVEIEFSVLSRSCLKQRLSGEEALRREVDALVTERNAARATINWRFNTRDARTKLHRLYPSDFTVD